MPRKSIKNLFKLLFMFCNDIQNMDLTNAFQSLMALFAEHISSLSTDITYVIKSKVRNGYPFNPHLYRLCLEIFCWES